MCDVKLLIFSTSNMIQGSCNYLSRVHSWRLRIRAFCVLILIALRHLRKNWLSISNSTFFKKRIIIVEKCRTCFVYFFHISLQCNGKIRQLRRTFLEGRLKALIVTWMCYQETRIRCHLTLEYQDLSNRREKTNAESQSVSCLGFVVIIIELVNIFSFGLWTLCS